MSTSTVRHVPLNGSLGGTSLISLTATSLPLGILINVSYTVCRVRETAAACVFVVCVPDNNSSSAARPPAHDRLTHRVSWGHPHRCERQNRRRRLFDSGAGMARVCACTMSVYQRVSPLLLQTLQDVVDGLERNEPQLLLFARPVPSTLCPGVCVCPYVSVSCVCSCVFCSAGDSTTRSPSVVPIQPFRARPRVSC